MELPETFVEGFHSKNEILKMQYNLLGTTGLRVSKISLGTAGFSEFYGEYNLDTRKKVVYEAIKSGVNYIDTAAWYGHGLSEQTLGESLQDIPRQAYYIATKCCRYRPEVKDMFDFSAKRTFESIDESLKRLKLDYVDILQIHDIEFAPSLNIVLQETLPAVQEIVKSGKARFIGITGYPLSILKDCIEHSTVKINTVLTYCRQTMIENELDNYITFFKENNIGVINGSVNAMGLLSSTGPPKWHPAGDEIIIACHEAREYCRANNVELGKLAVYYGLQQKGPDTVLIGMNSVEVLNMNLNTFCHGLNDHEMKIYEDVKMIFGKLKMKHWENVELQKYWKKIKDSCTCQESKS